jgi:hypothetical protein
LLSRDGDIYLCGWNVNEKQIIPKKLIFLNANKFIDIASHYRYNILFALSVNGVYYFSGKLDMTSREPKEIKVESFRCRKLRFRTIL